MSIMKIGKMIMTHLFKKPATLMYPVIPRKFEERTRGHIEIDVNECILCSICVKRCPTDAIAVERTGRTWAIDRLRCIQCGNCVDYCPKKCLYMRNAYTQPSTGKVAESFNIPQPAPKAAPATEPAAVSVGQEA